MPRVALHTLGCKVNQYETGKLAEDFRSRGFDLVDFSGQADVYVINTCTVTRTADSKSRQAARSAVRRNPCAAVVLTGCYAETSPDQLRSINGVTMVLGNQEKPHLVEYVVSRLCGDMPNVRRGGNFGCPSADAESAASISAIRNPQSVRGSKSAPSPPEIQGRTRALLKIQDGCDQFCAYCVVPFARPTMSSRPHAEVLAEAEELAGRGFKEIVLTGIRLGRYQDGYVNLTSLLEAIAGVQGIERIRLSSIEVTDVPEGLISLMARNRKLCRHLHVPLQSGDDKILSRMERPYTASEFESFVREVRSRVPGIAVTTDIMVGFPSETAEQFDSTCRLAARLRFARTHVFRYSPRPRTAAAELPDGVSAAEKEQRRTRLMDLAAASSQAFASTLVGEVVPVLAEGKQSGAKMWSGLTDNYVRTVFGSGSGRVGDIVDVLVESASGGTASGRLVT